MLSISLATSHCPSACLRPRLVPQGPAKAYAPPRASFVAPQKRRRLTKAAARSRDEVEAVPPAMLSTHDSEDELLQESAWLGNMIECWLNEEWPAQELFEVHSQLSSATGQAYLRLRRDGMEEVADMVLALAAELMAFDFMPTFTSAFEVSNKAVELLMLRGGCDVCCADMGAIARYEASLAAERQ